MSKEKLKQIFIEEATEIIEKMDIDILNFEDAPSDKGLLNEIFRGVHTLKGSANAFNFSRLGEFVHHFEDALDFFRSSEDAPTSQHVDVFLEAVTVIKAVLAYEVEETVGLPKGYSECLENIRQILLHVESKVADESVTCKDLACEFSNEAFDSPAIQKIDETELFNQLQENEKLFKIILRLDTDIYLRGFDHFLFFKNLLHVGRILSSFWSIPENDNLAQFDVERNEIKEVSLYLASVKKPEDITDVFAFLEEEEFDVMPLLPAQETIKVKDIAVATPLETKYEEKREVKEEPKDEKAKSVVAQKSFLKIDSLKLDELFDSIGELVIAQNYLGENG